MGVVPRLIDHMKLGVGDELRIGLAVVWRDDAIRGAPNHQGGGADQAEPTLQLWVVHVGLPSITAQRLPIAVHHHQLLVRHLIRVWRKPIRVMPAPEPDFIGPFIENIENIGRHGVADFDAQGVHQHQLLDPLAEFDRNFSGQPSAK
mgnify:CR=1 FL=1